MAITTRFYNATEENTYYEVCLGGKAVAIVEEKMLDSVINTLKSK